MSGATLWARNDIRRAWTSLPIVALLTGPAWAAVRRRPSSDLRAE